MNTSPAQASEFPEVLVEAALSTQRPVNTDIRITNLDAQIKHLSLDKLDNSTQIGLQGQRKDDGNGKGKEEMMIFDEWVKVLLCSFPYLAYDRLKKCPR
jgi:hypothetical protein